MNARLTIAIPTYNRASLLRRALRTALAQTSADTLVYVSDNGSTDETPSVLAEFIDPRLKTIRRTTTCSRAEHGALIFDELTTEFVLMLSDDDYVEPGLAEAVLDLLAIHPELSFVYTGCLEHYDDVAVPALVGPRIEDSLDFIAAHFSGRRHVSWCACVVRVADLRRLGPQPADRIIGDMFFWTQIAYQGPVGCVSEVMSHYTVLAPLGDNESRTVPVLQWVREVKLLCEECWERSRAHGAASAHLVALRQQMQRYAGRSAANQFLWARLYGASRLACLRLLPACLELVGLDLRSVARSLGAIALSPKTGRRLLLAAARSLARSRSSAVGPREAASRITRV